jgi:ADP-heptose:LPS heptosyltransferase
VQINPKIIKNILVVRNDRFGEFLLNIPAFRALKETFINARLIAIIDHYVKEMAESITFIDEAIPWTRRKRSVLEKLRLIRSLGKRSIDIAVMLNPSKEFNIITYLSGIPIRVGYNRKWGFLLTHKMEDKKYLGIKHEIDYNLGLVALIGAKTENKNLSLAIDRQLDINLTNVFNIKEDSGFLVLHPWTSDPWKQWPLNNFRELTQKIISELNMQIVIIGSKLEEAKSKELFYNCNDRLTDITGKTSLLQLADFLRRAKALISCDSGPVHLASAVGTPVIAIFRNDIPGKTAKRWGPWGQGHLVMENNNLANITVDEVFNKVKDKLRR